MVAAASNYFTVAQIYLVANPLVCEPLAVEHIKPRLLGHWSTSPALSFIYAHTSRLIRETGQEMLYLTGSGQGPALVAADISKARTRRSAPTCAGHRGDAPAVVLRPGGIPATCR